MAEMGMTLTKCNYCSADSFIEENLFIAMGMNDTVGKESG